jgi:hypothetical protein
MARGSGSLLAVIMLVALSGCGTESSSTAAVQPAAESSSSTEAATGASSEAPSEAPSATGIPVSVADVDVPPDLPSLVDTSTEAQQTFLLWMDYEAEGSSQGADRDLPAGYGVCVWKSQGFTADVAEGRLASEMGYVGSGPQAVVRSALAALCPEYDLGYRTDLDKHVDVYRTNLSALMTITPEPQFDQYGRMLTAVCNGMKDRTIAGLPILAHFRDRIASGELTLVAPPIEEHYLRVLIHQAVIVHCSGLIYALPPEVMNEPRS